MSSAFRNRMVSIGVALAAVAAARALVPEPARRAELLYAVVTSIGYGHLLGGAWLARARLLGALPRAARAGALGCALLGLATLFALHLVALAHAPAATLVGLLALSCWHSAENDAALDRAYRRGLRLGPMPRAPRHHARALAGAAGIGLLFATSRGASAVVPAVRHTPLADALPLDFVEVFALFGLHHLGSWAVLLADRARALARAGDGRAARSLARQVATLHAAALAPCAAAFWLPGEGAAEARRWLFSPALYLFWSALHVVQTAAARGVAPRARARGPRRSPCAGGPPFPR